MAKGKKAYLEARIALLERQLVETELIEARFGEDRDYPKETVLLFNIRFDDGGILYTYAAIKIKSDVWYTTATFARYKVMTFNALVETYLSNANEVWRATAWEEI